MKTREKKNPAFLNTSEIEIKTSDIEIVKQQFANLARDNKLKTAIIIGAGPGGLATGITLRREGWQVFIIENRTTFSRSNVIGINHAALGWFEQNGLLDALTAISSKTASFTDNNHYPVDEDLLNVNTWLNSNAKTVHTIVIKSLQNILSDKFLAEGGYLLSAKDSGLTNELMLNLTLPNQDTLQINTDHVELVIAADGANSKTRQKLMKLYSGKNHTSAIIPNEHFANMIITPKPTGLKHGLYFSNTSTGNIRAAISVSDEDVSVNFQTSFIAEETNGETVKRLIVESKGHMEKITEDHTYPENPSYFPLHGGKVSRGFKEDEDIADISMPHILVETPTTAATRTVYNNKFILIGDAKGISSPKAGLGASLAIAYDSTIIGLLARRFEGDQNNLHFAAVQKQLRDSISIWAQKTMEKVGISSQRNIHRFSFGKLAQHIVPEEKASINQNSLRNF